MFIAHAGSHLPGICRLLRRLAPSVLLFALAGCSGGSTSPTAPTPPTYQLMGRVVDASAGIPLAGVSVSAMDGPNVGKTTTTNADGRYTLVDLLSGSFTMRAQRTGYEDFLQQVTITAHTTIDIRLIPGRAVSSGWTGGQLFLTYEGQRIGARVTTAQVSQSGSNVTGQFTGADGSNGSFTGRVSGTEFNGSMRLEFLSGTRRCRGNAPVLTGTATGDSISLGALTVVLDDCPGTGSDLSLTLTP